MLEVQECHHILHHMFMFHDSQCKWSTSSPDVTYIHWEKKVGRSRPQNSGCGRRASPEKVQRLAGFAKSLRVQFVETLLRLQRTVVEKEKNVGISWIQGRNIYVNMYIYI